MSRYQNRTGFDTVRDDGHQRIGSIGNRSHLSHFFFFDKKRNNPHSRRRLSFFKRHIIALRRNHHLTELVDCKKPVGVDFKHTVNRCLQLNLAFLGGGLFQICSHRRGCQNFSPFILMQQVFTLFPNEQVFLAHRAKHRNVLLRNNMSLSKPSILRHPYDNLSQVVAQHMPDRLGKRYFFHNNLLHVLPY